MSHETAQTYILFLVAGTTYAIRSHEVRHIEMVEQVTPVPNAVGCLDGVVFSRGQIVPVLSLRARFGFERVPHDVRARLLVVQSGDRLVGLMVDSAREFVRIPQESIQPPSSAMANLSGRYLEGVVSLGDRMVLVLHVPELLDTSSVAGEIEAAAAVAARDETRV